MALHGSLEEFGLPETLQLIAGLGKTGLLRVSRAGEQVDVRFRDGNIVVAEVVGRTLADDLVGRLTRCGLLTPADLATALRLAARGHRTLPGVLLDEQLAPADAVRRAFDVARLEPLFDLVTWTRGEYRFEPGESPADASRFAPLTVQNLLLHGMQVLDEWPVIRARLPSDGTIFRRDVEAEAGSSDDCRDAMLGPPAAENPEVPIRATPESTAPESLAKESAVGLSEAETMVLDRIDGSKSVQQIIATILLTRFAVCRAVHDLWDRGLVVPVVAAHASPDDALGPRPSLDAAATAVPGARVARVVSLRETRRGTLSWLHLPRLLRDGYRRRVSGVLTVSSQRVSSRLVFARGSIVAASGVGSGERLGDTLVRLGMLTADVSSAAVVASGDGPIGRYLVREGLISEEQLDRAVERQVRDAVLRMFAWPSFDYELDEGDLDLGDLQTCDLSVAELILECCRGLTDVDVPRRLLHDDLLLAPPADQYLRFQKARLKAGEGYLLSRMDGKTSVRDLRLLSPLAEEDTYRMIYGLLQAGLVELVVAGRVDETASFRGPHTVGQEKREAPTRDEEVALELVRIKGLDANGILGVAPTADLQTVDAAYRSLAKRFHPDLGRTAAQKEMLERLFARVVWAGQTARSAALARAEKLRAR